MPSTAWWASSLGTSRLPRSGMPARTILTANHGPEASVLASLYHNLGGLEHARGAFATGEPLARRAVAIRTRTLGPEHPDVAADMAALAALLDGQGKYDEPKPCTSRRSPSSAARTATSIMGLQALSAENFR